MSAAAPRPDRDRWRDAEGIPIFLFCWVEQVREDPEPGVLRSRLHQRDEVVGGGVDSLYVRFPGHQLVILDPRLLRLVPDLPGD